MSHDLQAIREFCDHGLFLLNGQVRARGDIDEVIQEYMIGAWAKAAPSSPGKHATAKDVDILDVAIRDAQGRDRSTFQPWEPLDVCIDFRVNDDVDALILYVQATGEEGKYYFGTKTTLPVDRQLHGLRGEGGLPSGVAPRAVARGI